MEIGTARKILLCLRYGIGDLVMELPALETLRAAAPAAHITALGAYPAVELLQGDPRVDAIQCVQDLGFTHWGDGGSAEARQAFGAWLERGGFDLIIDPSHAVFAVRDLIWEGASCALLDAGQRLQDQALAGGASGLAAVKAAVLGGWGLEVSPAAIPAFSPTPAELEQGRTFLKARGLTSRPLVAISPVASSPLKRWPLAQLAAVADRAVEELRWHVLLLHGPDEALVEPFLRQMRHAERNVTPVGRLHLRQVATLLGRCRLFVGNDTGLMHLASAVGIPTVAVFGPTSPGIYLPRGAIGLGGDGDGCPHRLAAEFGPPACVATARCLLERDGCIGDTATDDVWAAVQRALGRQWVRPEGEEHHA